MHMNLTRVGICVVVGFFLSWICTSKFFIDTPNIILDAEDVDLGGSGSSSNEKGTRGIGPQLVRHVWSKMMDFDSYRKWSPYLYSIRPSMAASTKASSSTSTKSSSTSFLQKNTPLIFLFVVSDQQDKEKERKVSKDKNKEKDKDKKKNNKLFIERYGKIFHIDEGNSTKKKICWSYDNLWAKSYMMSEIECYQVELLPFDYIDDRKNEKEKRKEREKNAKAEEDTDETVTAGEADVGLDEEFEGGEPPPQHHHHHHNKDNKDNKDNKQSKKKARVRVRVRLWKWFSGPFSTVYSLLYHESISERMHLFAKELKKYLSA